MANIDDLKVSIDVRIVNDWIDEKRAGVFSFFQRSKDIIWTIFHPRRSLDRYYALIDIYVRQVIREVERDGK